MALIDPRVRVAINPAVDLAPEDAKLVFPGQWFKIVSVEEVDEARQNGTLEFDFVSADGPAYLYDYNGVKYLSAQPPLDKDPVEEMHDFAGAIAMLKRGQPVTRKSWYGDYYLRLRGGEIKICYSSGSARKWQPLNMHLLAEDWVAA